MSSRITANVDSDTQTAVREIAFKARKSVRQWAGEVIADAVKSTLAPKPKRSQPKRP